MKKTLTVTVLPTMFLGCPVFYVVINDVVSKRIVLNLVETGKEHLNRHQDWCLDIPNYVQFHELPNEMGIELFSDDSGDIETLTLLVCGKDNLRNTYRTLNKNMYFYYIDILENTNA